MMSHVLEDLISTLGCVVGVLIVLAYPAICLMDWMDSRPRSSALARRSEASRLAAHRRSIDALYDQAEEEVWRISRRGHGG